MYILDYQAFITLVFRLFWLSIYLVSKCLIFSAFTFTYYKSETIKILKINDIANKKWRGGCVIRVGFHVYSRPQFFEFVFWDSWKT